MLSKNEIVWYLAQALELFERAGIVLTPSEQEKIEIADFGLGQFDKTGLAVLVYVNTGRCCAKELAMLAHQTCPEHRHPPIDASNPGKEETFRCRWGEIYLYVPGLIAEQPQCAPPQGREDRYSVWHEIKLRTGDQYTLAPDTLHWFQAGTEGAVVSEFSTRSMDERDVFTDPEIRRVAEMPHTDGWQRGGDMNPDFFPAPDSKDPIK